jgi:hypothetical protein
MPFIFWFVLQKWVQLSSEQATITKLLHTLEHVGKRDVIDKFRQEYIDIFINTSRQMSTALANYVDIYFYNK